MFFYKQNPGLALLIRLLQVFQGLTWRKAHFSAIKSILGDSKGIFQRFARPLTLTCVKDIFDVAEEKSCYWDFRGLRVAKQVP